MHGGMMLTGAADMSSEGTHPQEGVLAGLARQFADAGFGAEPGYRLSQALASRAKTEKALSKSNGWLMIVEGAPSLSGFKPQTNCIKLHTSENRGVFRCGRQHNARLLDMAC